MFFFVFCFCFDRHMIAFAKAIALKCDRNLRRALLMLQVCATESNQLIYNPNSKLQIKRSPWEIFIEELAKSIVEEQTPQRLLLARNKLYQLLSNCIPPHVIFKKLTQSLMVQVDDSLKNDIAKWSAYHEHRMQIGSKPIIHIEAFIAKFMHVYKKWTITDMAAVFGDIGL